MLGQEFNLHEVTVYSTKDHSAELELASINWVVFFSPSGVKSAIQQCRQSNNKIASIGATTATEIFKHLNKQPHAMANKPNPYDLLKAVHECDNLAINIKY